jgi:hypothetical protein
VLGSHLVFMEKMAWDKIVFARVAWFGHYITRPGRCIVQLEVLYDGSTRSTLPCTKKMPVVIVAGVDGQCRRCGLCPCPGRRFDLPPCAVTQASSGCLFRGIRWDEPMERTRATSSHEVRFFLSFFSSFHLLNFSSRADFPELFTACFMFQTDLVL